MVKLRYGTQGQVSFDDLNEYYYALGFLANSRNKSFGEGTVISSGEYIKIIFPKHGEKTFTNPGAFEMGFLKL